MKRLSQFRDGIIRLAQIDTVMGFKNSLLCFSVVLRLTNCKRDSSERNGLAQINIDSRTHVHFSSFQYNINTFNIHCQYQCDSYKLSVDKLSTFSFVGGESNVNQSPKTNKSINNLRRNVHYE